MRMNRRNVLVGLGTIVAGGGAALGTGAFSTVEANRDVSVEIADDANAFLAIDIHEDREEDDEFVELDEDGDHDIVEFDFSGEDTDANGLNEDAVTRFDNLVTLTNNGSEPVEITISAYTEDGDGEVDNEISDGFTAYEGDTESDVIDGDTLDEEDDEQLHVGFEFDTREDHTDDEDDVDDIEIIQITAETSTEGSGSGQ